MTESIYDISRSFQKQLSQAQHQTKINMNYYAIKLTNIESKLNKLCINDNLSKCKLQNKLTKYNLLLHNLIIKMQEGD